MPDPVDDIPIRFVPEGFEEIKQGYADLMAWVAQNPVAVGATGGAAAPSPEPNARTFGGLDSGIPLSRASRPAAGGQDATANLSAAFERLSGNLTTVVDRLARAAQMLAPVTTPSLPATTTLQAAANATVRAVVGDGGSAPVPLPSALVRPPPPTPLERLLSAPPDPVSVRRAMAPLAEAAAVTPASVVRAALPPRRATSLAEAYGAAVVTLAPELPGPVQGRRRPALPPPADPEADRLASPRYLSGYRTGDPDDRRFLLEQLRALPDDAARARHLGREADDLQDVHDNLGGLSDDDRRMYRRNAGVLRREAGRLGGPVAVAAGGGGGGAVPPVGVVPGGAEEPEPGGRRIVPVTPRRSAGLPDPEFVGSAGPVGVQGRRSTGLSITSAHQVGPGASTPGDGTPLDDLDASARTAFARFDRRRSYRESQAEGRRRQRSAERVGPRLDSGEFRAGEDAEYQGSGTGGGAEPSSYELPPTGSVYREQFAAAFPNAQVPGTGPSVAQRAFPTFLGANGGPSLFSRAGVRQALGSEGLRGLARYYGAYGIAEVGTSALRQQNQYSIGMAGATSSDQVLDAQQQYALSSPLASVPIVGGLGSQIHEATGGFNLYDYFGGQRRYTNQADLARIRAETGIARGNSDLMRGQASDRYRFAAEQGSLRGDFQGQREAISATLAGQQSDRTTTLADQATRIGNDIGELQAHNIPAGVKNPSWLERGVFSLAGLSDNDDKISGLRTQLAVLRQRAKEGGAADVTAADLQQAAVNRQESSDVIGSGSRVAALNFQGTNYRAATRLGIAGSFDARIAGTSDEGERRRLGAERDATLGAEARGYNRDTGLIFGQTVVNRTATDATVLGAAHYDYAAGLTSIQSRRQQASLTNQNQEFGLSHGNAADFSRIQQFDQQLTDTLRGLDAEAAGLTADFKQQRETIQAGTRAMGQRLTGDFFGAAQTETVDRYAALRQQHPENADLYDRQEFTERRSIARDDQQQRFGTALTTRRIGEQADESDLANRGLGTTASVQSILSGTSDAIELVNANPQLRGATHAAERRDQIAQLSRLGTSRIAGLTTLDHYHGRADEVSAFVTGGDADPLAFEDYQEAVGRGAGASRRFAAAATADPFAAPNVRTFANTIGPIADELPRIATAPIGLLGGLGDSLFGKGDAAGTPPISAGGSPMTADQGTQIIILLQQLLPLVQSGLGDQV